jgi:hypothetical protein
MSTLCTAVYCIPSPLCSPCWLHITAPASLTSTHITSPSPSISVWSSALSDSPSPPCASSLPFPFLSCSPLVDGLLSVLNRDSPIVGSSRHVLNLPDYQHPFYHSTKYAVFTIEEFGRRACDEELCISGIPQRPP